MGVFTAKKLASTANSALGAKPPVGKYIPAPHWVWSSDLAPSFLHPPRLDQAKRQAAPGSTSWWWAPPGGIFKHSPSPLLVVGAPWWHLQALSISAADEACTLKRGLQGGGPLPVETENQRGGAEALPGALRGIRRPLPAQMDGVAKSQRNRSNVPHVLQPLGPHPSDVESTG